MPVPYLASGATRSYSRSKTWSVLEPCPSVQAQGGAGSTFALELVIPMADPYLAVTGRGYQRHSTKPLTEPAPAVEAEGILSAWDSQVEVVLPVPDPYLAYNGEHSFKRDCTRSLTEPAPATTTGGIGGGDAEVVLPTTEPFLATRVHGREAVRRLRAPAPAVTARGLTSGADPNTELVVPTGWTPPTPDPRKPPYALPTMAAIAAVPATGLTHVSSFSGGGGTCLGFRMAGFRTLWANDCDPSAQETYARNFPDVVLDARDVREVTAADILQATGLARGELDVFEGSPPCTAFSTAGKRTKGWNEVKKHAGVVQERVEDLFFEYVRLLDGLSPRAFVAENVVGMTHGKVRGLFNAVLAGLRAAGPGYLVEARILDAQYLGVAQTRARVIFVGVRRDQGKAPAFPRPLPYRYSFLEANPAIYGEVFNATAGTGEGSRSAHEPAYSITTQSVAHLKVREQTIRRPVTIDEVRRICSFPPDYWLPASKGRAWARLGNAVPPVMAFHVARALAVHVFDALVEGPAAMPWTQETL